MTWDSVRTIPGVVVVVKGKARVVILGDKATGKSCLIDSLLGKPFQWDKPATISYTRGGERYKYSMDFLRDCGNPDVIKKVIGETLTILDAVGQVKEEELPLLEDYCAGIDGVILVGDMARPETFWYKGPKDKEMESGLNNRWIPTVMKVNGKIPMILVGTKWDLAEYDREKINDVKKRVDELKKHFSSLRGEDLCRTSAKTGLNVQAPFVGIVQKIMEMKEKKASWFENLNSPNAVLKAMKLLFEFYYNNPKADEVLKFCMRKKIPKVKGVRMVGPKNLKALASALIDFLKVNKSDAVAEQFKLDFEKAFELYKTSKARK